MALWGDRDNFQSVAVGVATVNLSNNTIEIKPGPFTAGIGTISPIIKLGLGATCGYAQIVGITSAALVTIASTDALIPNAAGAIAGVAYSLTTMPRYLDEDPLGTKQTRTGISTVRYFGVGSTAMYNAFENLSDSGNLGLAFTSAYRPAHSGWVGVQTYTDNHGNFRVKTEVLVAMSGIQTGNEPYPNYKA
jgi:hypothetical protein